MESAQIKSSVSDLLREAGIGPDELDISAVAGGGNNRVYAVHTRDSTCLAKIYYSNPDDPRDRLGTEYAFLSYARKAGIDCVPEPIFCSPRNNIGLYEFVEGRKLTSAELNRELIMQAASFLRQLNAGENRDRGLPTASEGCFSLAQHFSLVDRRIERLQGIPADSKTDREAGAFVEAIRNAWRRIRGEIAGKSDSLSADLDLEDRCISPSDFGFHNALLRSSGAVCFIDFEYAGWDDPAKAIGDFFSQPAVPVPLEHFDAFVSESLGYSKNGEALAARARLLLPMFQIKWCCIMLNEFLPDAARRRRFANPAMDPEQGKRLQLEKAQRFFNSRLG